MPFLSWTRRARDAAVGVEERLQVEDAAGVPEGSHRGFGQFPAIARQIAVDHGGTIGLVSEPGRGTTFTIRLPAT
ncbi:ATP-binding protein [Catellatospora methionotrophica]|uniref:ATP-binding protein n=1 Tax=Catellatospora methionotrophica TaxID=121620 RepID=UPI00140D4BF9|nr:ATP-binding protein [Catellatospora methionotrophica]